MSREWDVVEVHIAGELLVGTVLDCLPGGDWLIALHGSHTGEVVRVKHTQIHGLENVHATV